MPEAPRRLRLRPRTSQRGWFVVNVRDAMWLTLGTRGSLCEFEGQAGEFPQLGSDCTSWSRASAPMG